MPGLELTCATFSASCKQKHIKCKLALACRRPRWGDQSMLFPLVAVSPQIKSADCFQVPTSQATRTASLALQQGRVVLSNIDSNTLIQLYALDRSGSLPNPSPMIFQTTVRPQFLLEQVHRRLALADHPYLAMNVPVQT